MEFAAQLETALTEAIQDVGFNIGVGVYTIPEGGDPEDINWDNPIFNIRHDNLSAEQVTRKLIPAIAHVYKRFGHTQKEYARPERIVWIATTIGKINDKIAFQSYVFFDHGGEQIIGAAEINPQLYHIAPELGQDIQHINAMFGKHSLERYYNSLDDFLMTLEALLRARGGGF